ncbi:MAG: MFS transporter, partial [Clostridia bacterium]
MKESAALKHGGDANFNRNAWAFSLGGIGRDMAYTLWANFIVIAVLLTKGLDTAQFSILSVIIIVCRIFDAINDPIMGGLVEATSTKWGKFKPWILIGVVTNCVILYTTFAVPLYGNDFLIFFPFAYILWDITFTMNDIGYWSMLPSLTSNEKDRNTISTMANLTAGIGAGAIGLFLPMLTNGDFAVGGNAVTAYKILPAIICGVFLLCQIMTVCVVKEKPEHKMIIPKSERTGLKHMIGVLRHNDQLQWIATSMFFFNIGSAVLGSLISYYVYFT